MSYSPYAPPQQNRGVGYSEHGDFRSAGWTTNGTVIGLIVSVVLTLIVTTLTTAYPMSARPTNLTFSLVMSLLGLVQGGISLAASIVFLVWMHRASANAHTFGHEFLEYTPGWCVGWWFVPIANLWKPYQALKEIWRASDPEAVGIGARNAWMARGVPSLFPMWWITYQISGFVALAGGVLYASAALTGKTPGWEAGVLTGISQLFSIISVVAIITIVRQLAARQETCWLKLSSGPSDV